MRRINNITWMNSQQHRSYVLEKRMLYALRHNPSFYGLSLNKQGWVNTRKLAKGIKRTYNAIAETVLADPIERYEANQSFIRARYGHGKTIPKIIYEKGSPPDVLFCVVNVNVNIPKFGLIPINRQYIHLSSSIDHARDFINHSNNKLFSKRIMEIKSEDLMKNGLELYQANSVIWLIDKIEAGITAITER